MLDSPDKRVVAVLLLLPLLVLLPGFVSAAPRIIADLQQPTDVVVDDQGRIYVLEGVVDRIRVFDRQGRKLSEFGGGQLNLPLSMAIDGDELWVADTGNHRLTVFGLDGVFRRALALPALADDDRPAEPAGIALRDDLVYWSDRAGHRLCRQHKVDGRLLDCRGKRGQDEKSFDHPFQMAFDRDGYLGVVDVLNARIARYHARGQFFSVLSGFGTEPGRLYRPNGIAFSPDGRLFVSDSYSGRISVFDHGRFEGFVAVGGRGEERPQAPVGLYWKAGSLYVSDALAGRLLIIDQPRVEQHVRQDRVRPAASSSRQRCVLCHYSWSSDERHLPPPATAEGLLPVSSRRMCYSCHHGAVIESRQRIGMGSQHPDIHHPRSADGKPAEREDEIDERFPLVADGELGCGSCHTPHPAPDQTGGAMDGSHRNRWMRVNHDDGRLCRLCHESRASDIDQKRPGGQASNHPVGVRMAAPPAPKADGYAGHESLQHGLPRVLKLAGSRLGRSRELLCQSCHQPHGGEGDELLPSGFDAPRLCSSCHQRESSRDRDDARRKGVHPTGVRLEEPVRRGGKLIRRVECSSCHAVHEAKGKSLLVVATDRTEQLCRDCHQRHAAGTGDDARERGIHVVDEKLEEPVELGGEHFERVACLSCHSVHDGKPGTPALRVEHRDGQLCEACHQGYSAVVHTDHDLRITAADSENRFEETPEQSGVCGSCHSMHRGKGGQPMLYAARAVEGDRADDEALLPRDALCLNCHQKDGVAGDAVVTLHEHPWKQLVLRSDSKHMPLIDAQGKVAEFGRIACVTCHDPHHWSADRRKPGQIERWPDKGNREGTILDSFLRTRHLENSFCVDCHGIETRIRFKYYHDELGRQGSVDYVR